MDLRSPRHRRDEAREISKGWDLVRGGLADWNNNPELREVERLSSKVDRLGDAWLEYNAKRILVNGTNERISNWQETLVFLEQRQLSLLDAVRAVNMIGRPSAGSALLRSVYEVFLAILLIAFRDYNSRPIDRKLVKESRDTSVTGVDLAARFTVFGFHGFLSILEGFEKIWSAEELESTSADELRKVGGAARSSFGFSREQDTWHPFKHTWAIKEYLWSAENKRNFPVEPVEMEFTDWNYYFRTCFVLASHDSHSSNTSLLLHERRTTEGLIKGAERDWSHRNLQDALNLVIFSLGSVAYALDTFETFVREIQSRDLPGN